MEEFSSSQIETIKPTLAEQIYGAEDEVKALEEKVLQLRQIPENVVLTDAAILLVAPNSPLHDVFRSKVWDKLFNTTDIADHWQSLYAQQDAPHKPASPFGPFFDDEQEAQKYFPLRIKNDSTQIQNTAGGSYISESRVIEIENFSPFSSLQKLLMYKNANEMNEVVQPSILIHEVTHDSTSSLTVKRAENSAEVQYSDNEIVDTVGISRGEDGEILRNTVDEYTGLEFVIDTIPSWKYIAEVIPRISESLCGTREYKEGHISTDIQVLMKKYGFYKVAANLSPSEMRQFEKELVALAGLGMKAPEIAIGLRNILLEDLRTALIEKPRDSKESVLTQFGTEYFIKAIKDLREVTSHRLGLENNTDLLTHLFEIESKKRFLQLEEAVLTTGIELVLENQNLSKEKLPFLKTVDNMSISGEWKRYLTTVDNSLIALDIDTDNNGKVTDITFSQVEVRPLDDKTFTGEGDRYKYMPANSAKLSKEEFIVKCIQAIKRSSELHETFYNGGTSAGSNNEDKEILHRFIYESRVRTIS